MHTLYGLFILMFIGALSLWIIPSLKYHENLKPIFFISLFMLVASFSLYQVTGDKNALAHWFTQGKQHYQLLEKFNQLGGVPGAIARIREKLTEHPNDVQGWFILGKLYLSSEDYSNARLAFAKAHELQPDDPKISQYYEMIQSK